MIEGLNELKNEIRIAKREKVLMHITNSDMSRMAEWLLELEERVDEIERKG